MDEWTSGPMDEWTNGGIFSEHHTGVLCAEAIHEEGREKYGWCATVF